MGVSLAPLLVSRGTPSASGPHLQPLHPDPPDPRGSPTLDDISDFTRGLTAGLEEALGEEVAASLQYEVSSPVRRVESVLACACVSGPPLART